MYIYITLISFLVRTETWKIKMTHVSTVARVQIQM